MRASRLLIVSALSLPSRFPSWVRSPLASLACMCQHTAGLAKRVTMWRTRVWPRSSPGLGHRDRRYATWRRRKLRAKWWRWRLVRISTRTATRRRELLHLSLASTFSPPSSTSSRTSDGVARRRRTGKTLILMGSSGQRTRVASSNTNFEPLPRDRDGEALFQLQPRVQLRQLEALPEPRPCLGPADRT